MTTEEFKRDILLLQPRLQRIAEHIVGDPDSAADAVQEAVITLWEQRLSLSSNDLEKLAPTVVKMAGPAMGMNMAWPALCLLVALRRVAILRVVLLKESR